MPSSLSSKEAAAGRPLAEIVWVAVALGLLADLLLRQIPWGLNATLWTSLLAVAGWRAVHGSDAPAWPLFTGVVFAAGFAWRSSAGVLVLGGALLLVSIALPLLRDPRSSGPLRHAMALLATLIGAGILAPVALAERVRRRRTDRLPAGRLASLARGALLAVPFLLAFGALFSAADPLFEWYVGDVFDFILKRFPSHAAMSLLGGWIALGILFGLMAVRLPVRSPAEDGSVGRGRSGTEAVVAVLLVDALFLFFLLVQLRTLFGGRELVETTLGLSYAEYAREGFFQLIVAAAVALSGLLAADWWVPAWSSRRRPFNLGAAVLLVLVAAVLASAAGRMRLYVSAYGLTELRLYTSAFMVWLAFVLAWFAGTVLKGRRERFMGGALGGLAVVWLGLAVLNPDAVIVRANVARLSGTRTAREEVTETGFDARYAATLGADAAPSLLAALPRFDPWRRCVVAAALLADDADRPADFRSWSWGRHRAGRAVSRNRPALTRAFRFCPVRLRAPDVTSVEAPITIAWTGFTSHDDHVAIVRSGGSDDEAYMVSPTSSHPLTLSAPRQPGSYEIRYELGDSRRVVSRKRLDVRPVDQPPPAEGPTGASQSAGSPTRSSPSSSTTP